MNPWLSVSCAALDKAVDADDPLAGWSVAPANFTGALEDVVTNVCPSSLAAGSADADLQPSQAQVGNVDMKDTEDNTAMPWAH